MNFANRIALQKKKGKKREQSLCSKNQQKVQTSNKTLSLGPQAPPLEKILLSNICYSYDAVSIS